MLAISDQRTLIDACYEAEILHRHDPVKVIELRRLRAFLRYYNLVSTMELRKIYNFGYFRGTYNMFPVRSKSDVDFCNVIPIQYFRSALESLRQDWKKRTDGEKK